MKVGAGWDDTCILNISSSGLMLQSAHPPRRGSYLEIRRGALIIIAKVMWSESHRFGVKTQDALPIDAIVGDGAAPQHGEGMRVGERRSSPRAALPTEQRCRHGGRLMEYGFVIALGVASAGLVATEVHALLSAPVSQIAIALDGSR